MDSRAHEWVFPWKSRLELQQVLALANIRALERKKIQWRAANIFFPT
jgi:hypothetical protein